MIKVVDVPEMGYFAKDNKGEVVKILNLSLFQEKNRMTVAKFTEFLTEQLLPHLCNSTKCTVFLSLRFVLKDPTYSMAT